MRAIAAFGFIGCLARQCEPTRDPMPRLREAVALCDV